jgi:hypothetical protein
MVTEYLDNQKERYIRENGKMVKRRAMQNRNQLLKIKKTIDCLRMKNDWVRKLY